MSDFHILPAKFCADSRSKCLGNGFLGRETGRIKLSRGVFTPAILSFMLRKNPTNKPFSMALERARNFADLSEVQSNADDHAGWKVIHGALHVHS